MHTEDNFKYFKIQLSKKTYFKYMLHWLRQVKLCSGNKQALTSQWLCTPEFISHSAICSDLWQRVGFCSSHPSGS